MKSHFSMAVAAIAAGGAMQFAAPSVAQTAQDMTNVYTCRNIGADLQPLGEREAPPGQGHWLMVSGLSCHIDSGPLAGGVATGSGTWELNGPTSKELTFSFVVRKPGATVVVHGTEGKMDDPAAGSGKFDYVLATGGWAPLAGKSETWTLKGTGPWEWTVEGKVQ